MIQRLLLGILVATALAPAARSASAGDVSGGEIDPEGRAGASTAVYHLDQSLATFETTVATELGNGNKLVDVEVLVKPGPTATFSGVFYPVSGTIHTLIQGTQFEWDTFLSTVQPLDGRWIDLEVVSLSGTDRWYSAIFLEDGDDYGYYVDSDMTDAQLQTLMEDNLRQNYRMTDFEAYTIPATGETRFAAIWSRDPNQPMTHLYYDLEIDDVVDLWSPLAGHIIDFERYDSSFYLGQERFALLVANVPGGEWYVDTWMTESELATTNANESDADTHLIDLHVFLNGSDVRYSGVWGDTWKSLNEVASLPVEDTVSHPASLSSLIASFENPPNSVGVVGFYAKNLRTGQSVSYRKDEPFYLASSTKTAVHIRLWQMIEAGHFSATGNQNSQMAYSLTSQKGDPWYMDERPNPGFGTGGFDGNNNATANDLGMSFSLNRFDQAMMQVSDNAATSALVDDPTFGLSWDATNLNEWLSSVAGVGQGWGIVTSIQDVDRLVLWQSQHTEELKDNPSYFLAPGHTLRPRLFGPFTACSTNNGANEPSSCVPPSSCTRCFNDAGCGPNETCRRIEDPWGDLRPFFGLTSTQILPGCTTFRCFTGTEDILDKNTGRTRYFNTGINSATPRAYSNLLEKFVNGEFLSSNTAALGNMLGSAGVGSGNLNTYQLANGLCRYDTDGAGDCDPRDGYTLFAVKGGVRGSASDTPGTATCADTGVIQMNGTNEVFTLSWFVRDGSVGCGTVRSAWAPLFGVEMLRAIAVDLTPAGGSFTPTTAGANDELRVDTMVNNLGGGISPAFDIDIYASTDAVIDTGDVKLGTVPSGGPGSFGGVGVGNWPIQLTGQLDPGSYYIGMIVDTSGDPNAGEVPELDETAASNNGLLTTQLLTILPPCTDDDSDGFATCDAGCDSFGMECGDCDDGNAVRYPGNVELCDGIDNDCDTIVDNNVPTPLAVRRVEYEDPVSYDNFGASLANVGDMNGDAIDDFVVGMPGAEVGSVTNAGLVRLVSGADQTTICDAVLPAPSTSDNLGFSAAAARGDLGVDGQNDFVVGVPHYDGVAITAGAVSVFNGPDCAFVRLMEDPAMTASDRLGHSVASIGDVDGDTVPDIAAGSIYSSLSGVAGGAITLFSGADGSVLFTMFDPTAAADDLGDTLVGPGDLTGDGIPDVAAGAPNTDVISSSNGAIYVFDGLTGAYVDRYVDPVSDSTSRLGESLAVIGDLVGDDGVPELVAGQIGDIVNGDRTGSAAIFNGATGALVLRLVNPLGLGGSSERFPSSLAAIPDVSGDGLPDVVAGAEGDDDLDTNAGSVFVFNSLTGGVLHHVFDPAGKATDMLGTQVIGLGDISGDGVPDFAAGAPQGDDIEANQAGHVVVFVLEEDCDNDGVTPYAGDCDDDDPAVNPGATDVCDTVDNDCDGVADEDADGDGYGVCDDCNDRNPLVNPGAIEICNGINDDCDGTTDASPSLPDLDGDGVWGPCSDCDNNNPDINFLQDETCNHIDDDCSGLPDDGFAKVVSTRFSWLPDGRDNDELATDVAAIGDVNDDGIPDYVAGAPLADLNGSNTGAAAVFDGATGGLICIATPGTMSYEQAGTSVAGVGDVNGDGGADFVMGAPFHDSVTQDEGKLYVINGRDCTVIRELVDSDAMPNDRLGLSVAGVGDLTGDGIGEIVGGASWAQTPYGNQNGAVLVWDGATGAELFKLIDPHTGSNRLGSSVSGVGDVNADGVPDIVAGAPYDDGLLGGDVGSVLVFSGADGSIVHKLFDPAGTGSDWLGWSVAGVSDLTGDAIPDILAGAPNEDTGGSNQGAILVFSGADGSLAQRVPLVGSTTNEHFGESLAVVGDLTGDLVPEFAGGAPDDDTIGSNAGRVIVIDGADFSVLHDITLADSSVESNFGFALDAVADLNGDGEPDLLIAQPRQNTLEDNDVGRVVVWSYGSDCDADGVGGLFLEDCDDQDALRGPGFAEVCDGIDNDCDIAIDEDEDGDGDDACVDCAPLVPTISTSMSEVCNAIDDDCDGTPDDGIDADGDTFTTPCDCNDADVNVNASAVEACNTIDDDCDGEIDEGFAVPLDQRRILEADPQSGDDNGQALALVGDVDGDSAPDFVIGVPGDDTAINGGGAAVLVSGATLTEICRLLDPSALTADALGYSVAGIGDVTGDGVPDVAVGSRSDDGNGQASGAVQVFGGADCAWVRELSDPAGEAGDLFGTSIASIGDVTGDLVPDIAVGANDDHENGYVDVGSVSVFDGATGQFLYKALDPAGRNSDQLGISVSALGDVDFDGVPDFAAGAFGDGVLGSSPGSVNLFSGVDGRWIRAAFDTTLGANGYVGRSVAAAGDMNGDGVPDLITGAEGDDTGGINAGAVLAFSGLDGSLIRRYVDSSPLSSSNLGAAVTSAGDLNGDGITEILAGAPDSSRTGSSAGEAVLFDGATGAVLHRFTDASSLSGDDFGYAVLAADLNGGGVEILVGAPNGDPAGLNSAGYVTLFTLDADCDGDGLSPLADCDDTNGATQGQPGPARSLVFADKTTLEWEPPSDAGLSPDTLVYDVVRSDDPSDFVTTPVCVEFDDASDVTATDGDDPSPGSVFAYLVRAETRCGGSAGSGRSVGQCP